MKWKTLQSTTLFKVVGVSHVLRPMQRVSHRLEIFALRERMLLQDQVQLGIGPKVQL